MRGLNLAVVVGYVGQDPELKYMASGMAVANVSVATTESWKDKQTGEQKERTEWHRCVCYGRTAEVAGQYVKKGDIAAIVGKERTRKWTDKGGAERYTTEIIVDVLQFHGKDKGQPPSEPPASDDGFDDDGLDRIPF